MKKSIVKILTAALAAATVASMSVLPVFAADSVFPQGGWVYSDEDPTADHTDPETYGTARKTAGTITVTDLREADGLTVTAYQIVKGVYKNGVLAGYTVCDLGKDPDDDTKGLTIKDIENPTADEITAIAKNINGGKSSLNGIVMSPDAQDETTYTADVEAGLYIVLARGGDAVVYNPAIVAVNVLNSHLIVEDNEPFLQEGTVSFGAESYFNIPANAYLKSSDSGFDKKILGSHKHGGATLVDPNGDKGDTVAFGDTIDFKLDSMTIPSYSDEYTDVVFKIEDNLAAEAFLGVLNFKVKVAGEETAASIDVDDDNDPDTDPVKVTQYTLKLYDADGEELDLTDDHCFDNAVAFSVDFDDAFIRANDSAAVEITYSTVFQNTAGVNYAENKNRATLTYSNNPNDTEGAKTKDKTTYHYTFGIDATVDGQNIVDGKLETEETYEFNKVYKNDGQFKDGTTTEGLPTQVNEFALPGATFTLYSAADCAEESVITESVSDDNGHIKFLGLDEGTYYVKETHAPRGFVLNDKLFRFVIEADLDEATGVLSSYTITTAYKGENGYVEVGSATYTNKAEIEDDGNVINVIDHDVTPVDVLDPKIEQLPSTGGIGTIVITVTAAVGMAGFLTLFLYNRKKRKEEADKK